jgi:hypothetical protein
MASLAGRHRKLLFGIAAHGPPLLGEILAVGVTRRYAIPRLLARCNDARKNGFWHAATTRAKAQRFTPAAHTYADRIMLGVYRPKGY